MQKAIAGNAHKMPRFSLSRRPEPVKACLPAYAGNCTVTVGVFCKHFMDRETDGAPHVSVVSIEKLLFAL